MAHLKLNSPNQLSIGSQHGLVCPNSYRTYGITLPSTGSETRKQSPHRLQSTTPPPFQLCRAAWPDVSAEAVENTVCRAGSRRHVAAAAARVKLRGMSFSD